MALPIRPQPSAVARVSDQLLARRSEIRAEQRQLVTRLRALTHEDTEARLKVVKAIQERIADQLPLSGVREAAQGIVDSVPEGGSVTFESSGESVTIEGRPHRVKARG